MGVDSSPSLEGAADGNSYHGPIVSWVRAIDGLNTHDVAYELAAAGGVTTSLILPGSANAIGTCPSHLPSHTPLNRFVAGEAYVIKQRQTKERSPTSLLVEPPFGLNTSTVNYDIPPRWRHLKHACGVYNLPCVALLTDRVYPQAKILVRGTTVSSFTSPEKIMCSEGIFRNTDGYRLGRPPSVCFFCYYSRLCSLRVVDTTKHERSKRLKMPTAKKPWPGNGMILVTSQKS